MQPFDYVAASNLDQVLGLLGEHGADASVLSGGTDLLIDLREGRKHAKVVIDVKNLPDTTELSYDAQNGLTMGAAVPCYKLYGHDEIAEAYPGLMDAATLIGGVQIQGRASMGGNLCTASPAGDSIPAMIALYAVATVAGPNGTREIPVEDFCLAPRRTAMEEGEFLVSLHIPAPAPGSGSAYLRFIPRNEMDIAVVGVGASVQLSSDGSTIEKARVSLGAVAPRPLLVAAVSEDLVGKPVNDETVELAADLAREAATPISDMRGTAEYRKHLAGVMTKRTLNAAIERARANRQ